MRPKDADGMANSVEPDQTAPLAKTCLSENLGSLCIHSYNNILGCCYMITFNSVYHCIAIYIFFHRF